MPKRKPPLTPRDSLLARLEHLRAFYPKHAAIPVDVADVDLLIAWLRLSPNTGP